MKNAQFKVVFLITITATLLLVISSVFPINLIYGQNVNIKWDYQGRIPTESERLATISTVDKYQLRYDLFLFDLNKSLPGPETIVEFYGLQTIPFVKGYYDKFYTSTETGGTYRFYLNKTIGLKWLNITSANAYPNSPDYNKELSRHYNETKLLLSTNKHKELFKDPSDPFGSDLAYPIRFVSLVKEVGKVVTWEVERRDGNIIGGYFYTFGPTDPLFSENKTSYVWPYYNISVAVATFRSAISHRHSITVGFSYIAAIGTMVIISSFGTKILRNKRRKRQ